MQITSLIEQGSSNFLVLFSTAILLGVFHGLEPGHSKTMMAAFIIAIRGTVTQAALLGLSATVSHTAIVWIVVLSGMYFFGGKFNAESSEPYFQAVSGVLIIVIALWMLIRTWKHQHHNQHGHGHEHHHDHEHDHDHHHHHEKNLEGLNVISPEYHDAHEMAHAQDIQRRFKSSNVTTSQIIFFGLTGGLIPCPASITVLLLCLQLKKIALGSMLVLCFSIGLAITMVVTGAAAALSANHLTKRWKSFSKLARRAPYFSSLLIVVIGLYVFYHGIVAL